MTRLAASLFVDTTDSALDAARRLLGRADLVEFRIDGARELDLSQLVLGRPLPAIVTARSREQGGRFSGSEDDRLALLARALDLGVEWVDVEWASWPRCRASLDGKHVIVSRHDFAGAPDAASAERFFREARVAGAAMGKLAVTPRSIGDVAALLLGLRRSGECGIALGMGRFALLSRVLAARAGSALVFGAAEEGGATAPGQPTIDELRVPYRVPSLGSDTRLFGLLGNPLGHSVGPWVHNALFARHAIDAVYVPFETDDVNDFFTAAESLGVEGFSVTIPHKETVCARLGDLSAESRALGAVNTVLRSGSGWRGENVDGVAAMDALDAALRAAGKDPSFFFIGALSVVLGAGGAARAIAGALRRHGRGVLLASRTVERARAVARDIGVEAISWDPTLIAKANLVVNATPCGMSPRVDETPIDVSLLRPDTWVFDAVYNPLETRLVREARSRGLHAVPGLGMFVYQAARQFQLFTGIEPDRDLMAALAVSRLDDRNIVLVGLRGCGKSTVGRRVADRLGRPFVDVDSEVASEAGATIAEIFAREGEPDFRNRERRALEQILSRGGQVVSAGGGAVLDATNRRLLRERGRCFYLDAPVDVLVGRLAVSFSKDPGRPPLTNLPLREELELLKGEREPFYREVALRTVEAGDASLDEVAQRLLNALGDLEG